MSDVIGFLIGLSLVVLIVTAVPAFVFLVVRAIWQQFFKPQYRVVPCKGGWKLEHNPYRVIDSWETLEEHGCWSPLGWHPLVFATREEAEARRELYEPTPRWRKWLKKGEAK